MSMLVLPPRQTNRMGSAYFDGARAVILSATKPTVRPAEVGGGALVTGDIWVDTTTGERWYWNSSISYWLSAWEQSIQSFQQSASTDNYTLIGYVGYANVLFTRFTTQCEVLTTNSGSQYWELSAYCGDISANVSTTPENLLQIGTGAITTAAASPNTVVNAEGTLNTVFDTATRPFAYIRRLKTSTPGNIYFGARIFFRILK